MSRSFKGVIAGITYTDPAEFEKAARSCGYRKHGRRIRTEWRVGMPVRIRLIDETSGTPVYREGQVWGKAPTRYSVWVALDNGRYARVWCESGRAEITDATGRTIAEGRVAA